LLTNNKFHFTFQAQNDKDDCSSDLEVIDHSELKMKELETQPQRDPTPPPPIAEPTHTYEPKRPAEVPIDASKPPKKKPKIEALSAI
jgi:hypothetical protein